MTKKKEEHTEPAEKPSEEALEAATTESRVKELEEALAAKEGEASANWDKFLRERADLENYRKRTQKEKEELIKYGHESLLLDILPAVDSLERALEHADDSDPVVSGVKMTRDLLVSSIKKFNAAPIPCERGTAFDPALHQAMQQVEDSGLEPNCVVDVYQKGYMLGERLLRPAMVTVSK